MNGFTLLLGGETVSVCGMNAEPAMSRSLEPFVCRCCDDAHLSCKKGQGGKTIEMVTKINSFTGGEEVSNFASPDLGSVCLLSAHDNTLQLCVHSSVGTTTVLQHRMGSEKVYVEQGADVAVTRLAMWFGVSMLLAPCTLAFIHASTVVVDGKAVIFLGESGTGKSTHARLWLKNIAGAELLNDDSPMLRCMDSSVEVYGTPWSGKTACYRNLHYPLAGVVRLRQSPQNNIKKLGTLQAFGAVAPSLPPQLMNHPYYENLFVDIVNRVICSSPVYMLDCRADDDAALLCHNTVMSAGL